MNLLNKFVLVVTLSFSVTFAGSRDIYVATSGASTSPYTNGWASAATNIEWAVTAANVDGDHIWISNGVYVLTNQINVDAKNFMISGTGGTVVIDGNDSNRCFYLNNVIGGLENLFITRGRTDNDRGGGVKVYYSRLTVRDCIFSNNVAATYEGGGMMLNLSTTTVQRCTFVENKGIGGGGGLSIFSATSTTLVDHCIFYTNTAGDSGGGILDASALTMITGCDFICNVATGTGGGVQFKGTITHSTLASNVSLSGYGGGGVYMGVASSLITNCYLSNNIASTYAGGACILVGTARNCVFARNKSLAGGNYGGGAIYMWFGAVQDCIIEENTSAGQGGGFFFGQFDSTLRNCLIRNNVSSGGGGGITFNCYGANTISSCTIVSNSGSTGGGVYDIDDGGKVHPIENSIIYFNQGGGNSNYYFAAGVQATFSNCCLSPALPAIYTNVNTITNSPLFVDWTSGNYHLDRSSPCVNAGVNRDWMPDAVDLNGHHRLDPFSGIVDIGCYEYVPAGTMFLAK